MISAMKNKPPLFSIVTITKENLAGLKKTGSSLENQSFRNFEWIVIDGNSSDGTKEYLETIEAHKISEPDSGIYHAMNKGLTLACGDYILFLNAGDMLADIDILATLATAAEQKPDFIYGDALETNGLYKKAHTFTRLDWGMFTHHQAMLYRRENIGDLRYDEALRIAADYGFTARFLQNARNVEYLPCAICIFEDGGVSQKNRKLGRREQFHIRKEFKHCGMLKNICIYAAQTMTASLRQHAPCVYKWIRKGFF